MANINQSVAQRIAEMCDLGREEITAIHLPRLSGDPKDMTELPASISALKNLREVDLNGANVTDISRLAQFTELKLLGLSFTPLTDLSILGGLKNLEVLLLWNVPITDLSFIAGMRSLKILVLSGTKVIDFSPLAKCKKLTELSVNDTDFTDVTLLKPLNRLRHLNMDNTAISSLAPLSDAKNLTELSAANTSVFDLSSLAGLRKLQGLRLDRTQVSDLRPLTSHVGLKALSLNLCPVNDLTPLADLNKLSSVFLADTQVQDISAIADKKLRDLLLDGSQVHDLMPLKANKSIPRIELGHTGFSFRDTAIAKRDPDGFGMISRMQGGYERVDALYRYFAKLNVWPPKRPGMPVTLVDVPQRPAQSHILRLERIKEDLLEVEERAIQPAVLEDAIATLDSHAFALRDAARPLRQSGVYIPTFKEMAEIAKDGKHPPRGKNTKTYFSAVLGFTNNFERRPATLNWNGLEYTWFTLSSLILRAQTEDQEVAGISAWCNAAQDLVARIETVLKKDPSQKTWRHSFDTPDDAFELDQRITSADLVLTALNDDDYYLCQSNARSIAVGLLEMEQRRWVSAGKDALTRNAIIAIGSHANDYIAGVRFAENKSEASLLWIKKYKTALTGFAETQEPAFGDWIRATITNAISWIKSGRPLADPHRDETLTDQFIDEAECGVWCGYYRYYRDAPLHLPRSRH